jgi:hypothetical protein
VVAAAAEGVVAVAVAAADRPARGRIPVGIATTPSKP